MNTLYHIMGEHEAFIHVCGGIHLISWLCSKIIFTYHLLPASISCSLQTRFVFHISNCSFIILQINLSVAWHFYKNLPSFFPHIFILLVLSYPSSFRHVFWRVHATHLYNFYLLFHFQVSYLHELRLLHAPDVLPENSG